MTNFVWMWPPTQPKTVPSDLSLDVRQARNTSFVHQSMIADTYQQQRQQKDRALSTSVASSFVRDQALNKRNRVMLRGRVFF